jgi:hypothetical protein
VLPLQERESWKWERQEVGLTFSGENVDFNIFPLTFLSLSVDAEFNSQKISYNTFGANAEYTTRDRPTLWQREHVNMQECHLTTHYFWTFFVISTFNDLSRRCYDVIVVLLKFHYSIRILLFTYLSSERCQNKSNRGKHSKKINVTEDITTSHYLLKSNVIESNTNSQGKHCLSKLM